MDPAPVPVKRHHGIVRFAHWLNAVALFGMIASGLQIYMAYRHFGLRGAPLLLPNPWDGKSIPEWGRLGGWLAGGLNWHFALAWPFVLTGLLYLGFLVVTGEWRALAFRPRDLRPAIQMQLYYLRLRKDHPAANQPLSLKKFLGLRHIKMAQNATDSRFVDDDLMKLYAPFWSGLCLPWGGCSFRSFR